MIQIRVSFFLFVICLAASVAPAEIFLGQGTMSGEVTDTSVHLQTRLTGTNELDANGDMPGATGVVCFQWSLHQDFRDAKQTPFQKATGQHDFIVRATLEELKPGTQYYYRAVYGENRQATATGPVCSFKTLPGQSSTQTVRFAMGSCMNYNKFMHGRAGKAGGPLTATEEDKRLGFPAFASMKTHAPDFFIGTGDIVYYDNKLNDARTPAELRQCWHEQFRFPRMVEFFQNVPGYWSKDDHDFRFNDSDNASDRLPLPQTGIELFREQLPIVAMNDQTSPTYRTHRINRQLQLWFTEGRDYRSPNSMPDGPDKTLWGAEQLDWLKQSLASSDAQWKILITPTPMVGPDMAKKSDNHTSLAGFRNEADAFFAWLKEKQVKNFMTFCGDRHWQYHSIHPSGIEEFACGALNDENSRVGIAPGAANGTDPDGLIKQPYTYSEPSGGYLMVEAGDKLIIQFHNSKGKLLNRVVQSSGASQ